MPPGPLTNLRRGANLVKQQALKRVNRRKNVGEVSPSELHDLIARHGADHSKVFVHAGLGDIKRAFGTNPYTFLRETLTDNFRSVLVPGFTDYFTTSGVYHKQYSRPKHGSFGPQFLRDADYRTDDAIKSILVEGPYRFDDCIHTDSYHEDGCFAKLVDEDTLLMNIGTPWLICSHLHYFESLVDVDYAVERTFDGVLCADGEDSEPIEQTSEVRTSSFYSWNRPKIARHLERDGALHSYDLNGLRVIFSPLGDMASSLVPRLSADPYYLVTL